MKKIVLADNHCHISKEYFDNPAEEVENLSKDSGLEYIVSMGVDYENDLENLKLKKEFNKPFLKIGIGLHPEEVIKLGSFYHHEVKRISEIARNNKDLIDFIGEIGIDFTYSKSKDYRKEQVDCLQQMCELAIELDKPVSIHARDSFDEIIKVIDKVYTDETKFNGFLHCFTGNVEQGIFFIEKGFKLGLGGIITYKKSEDLRNTVKELLSIYSDKDFNDLFGLETDTPYLSPEPVRSEKNNPRNIKIIAEFLNSELSL